MSFSWTPDWEARREPEWARDVAEVFPYGGVWFETRLRPDFGVDGVDVRLVISIGATGMAKYFVTSIASCGDDPIPPDDAVLAYARRKLLNRARGNAELEV